VAKDTGLWSSLSLLKRKKNPREKERELGFGYEDSLGPEFESPRG